MTTQLAIALLAATAAAAQTGSIVEGRVLSTVQNQPVGKVVVNLRPDAPAARAGVAAAKGPANPSGRGGSASEVWICETTGDGRFKFVNIPPGSYAIRANRPGYLAVPPGRILTAADFPPVKLQAGQNVTGIELHLTPTAAVTGRVVDNEGDAVRTGQVELMHYAWVQGKKKLQQSQGAQVDDRGEYRLYNVAPGSYFLRALPRDGRQGIRTTAQVRIGTAPVTGLSSSYYPDADDASRATEVYLAPGAELKNIDIRVRAVTLHSVRGSYSVEPDSNVQVRAVSPSGEPGGMAYMNMVDSVYVDSVIQNQLALTTEIAVQAALARANALTTPPAGTFEIDNLQPGKYTLIATQNKRGGNRQAAQEPPLQARVPIEIFDHDLDGVVITFKPPVRIAGSVIFEGSKESLPAGASNLFFQSDDADGNAGSARLKPDGSFDAALPAGVYHVRVANTQAEYLKSVQAGDKASPGNLLDTAQVTGAVKIVVSTEFGKVEGVVTDADGKPVYSAGVTFISDQQQPDWIDRYRSVNTDTNGHFSANVAPGEYRVYAWVGVEAGAPQSADFRKPYEDQAVSVKIVAGDNHALDLKAIH